MSEQRIRQLNRALEIEPENVDYLLEMAKLHSARDDYHQVGRVLEKVARLKPELRQAHFDLGLAYSRIDNFESALKAWYKMVDADGDLTLAELDRTHQGPALREWNKYLGKSDGSVFTYYHGGMAGYILGELQVALKAFDKVVNINADFEDVLYYRARVMVDLNRPADAIDGLNWLAAKRPQQVSAHYLLGTCLLKSGRDREAAASFKKAVTLNPNHVKSRLRMAEAFMGRGALEPTLKVLEEVFAFAPHSVDALLIKGACLEKAHRMDEAVWAYECALKTKPNSQAGHLALGRLFRTLARTKEALPHLRKAVELNPKDSEAHHDLGALQAQLGEHQKAIECFQEALRLSPSDPYTTLALGRSLIAAGKPGEACAFLEDLLTSRPGDRQVRLTLGRAAMAMQDFNKARLALAPLLDTNPNDEEVLALLNG